MIPRCADVVPLADILCEVSARAASVAWRRSGKEEAAGVRCGVALRAISREWGMAYRRGPLV